MCDEWGTEAHKVRCPVPCLRRIAMRHVQEYVPGV